VERTGESNEAEGEELMREEPVRVVLADDHAGFRRGLEEMLATDEHIEVVGEAENGAQAVALVAETRPDVVLLDLAMPGMGGKEALGLILQEVSPPPGVVILTMHDQPRQRRELLGMGANAFLPRVPPSRSSSPRSSDSVRNAHRESTLARCRRLLRGTWSCFFLAELLRSCV